MNFDVRNKLNQENETGYPDEMVCVACRGIFVAERGDIENVIVFVGTRDYFYSFEQGLCEPCSTEVATIVNERK